MAVFTAAGLSKTPISIAQAGQVVHGTGGLATVPVTAAANDVVKLAILPADHEPVDFVLDVTDLDANVSKTIAVTVGVLDAAGTDLVADTDFITTSTVAQAGGVARATNIKGLRLAASNADRVIAAKITTVAATEKAGTMRGTIVYKAK